MNPKRLLPYLIFSFFISTQLQAAPKQLTVVFLAEPVSTSGILPGEQAPSQSLLLAGHDFSPDNIPDNCIPREGGCFHPQYGMVYFEDEDATEQEEAEVYVPTYGDRSMDASEVDLVDCEDESNHFNLYCGGPSENNVSPTQAPQPYQVWIDISTSMRRVDYSRDPDFCDRRLFVEKLQRDCSGPLGISVFNTSLMPVTSMAATCRLQGNNSTQRIIDWVKRSNVEHLVIVTDVDEINPELMNFLDAQGARTIGAGDERIFSSQLTQKLSDILPACSS